MKIQVGTGILAFFLAGSAASIFSQTPKKSTHTRNEVPPVQTQASDKQDALSPDFKKQAWRALDALDRLGDIRKKVDLDIEGKMRMTDASKAIDEAKYVVSTDLDRYVQRALKMALISKSMQLSCNVLDPFWKPASERYLQCTAEVLYYLAPEQLSEQAITKAKARDCTVESTDGWLSEKKK